MTQSVAHVGALAWFRGACLYEGAVSVEGVKVVVEYSLADDVQSELGEQGLHVNCLVGVCNILNARVSVHGPTEPAYLAMGAADVWLVRIAGHPNACSFDMRLPV